MTTGLANIARRARRMLPWDCRCHDPVVFGHLAPCVLWESQPRPWPYLWSSYE